MMLKAFLPDDDDAPEQPEPGKKPAPEIIERYKKARERVGTPDRSARPGPMLSGGDIGAMLQNMAHLLRSRDKPNLSAHQPDELPDTDQLSPLTPDDDQTTSPGAE